MTTHDHDHSANRHPHDHEHEHEQGRPASEDRPHSHEYDHGHEHQRGLKAWVGELFRPHSHDAADSVDNALESNVQGIRAVKISLVALLVTAVAQAGIVVLTGSVALFADTIHNFSDALTAVPLWIAFALGRRPANRRYTYGYGRAEDLAGVFIVAMVALSAVLAGWESVRRLVDPQPLSYPWVVVAAGLIGFAGNELVALYRIRTGRAIGSAALVADGLHARTDGFTSLAVVLGAAGVMAGFPLADPIIGLVITIAILFVLKDAARDIYRRLMDAVDPALVGLTERTLAETPGVAAVESVRLRWIGHRVHAEAAIAVDPTLSVVQAHRIATEAHHRLLHGVPKLARAAVHVSPHGTDGDEQHRLVAHHHDQG
jgi:cation diffusion facilitator family transporter